MRGQYEECRLRMARLRCLKACAEAYNNRTNFPTDICYVAKDIEYRCSVSFLQNHSTINTYAQPHEASAESLVDHLKKGLPIGKVECDSETTFHISGEPIRTMYGFWVKVFSVKQNGDEGSQDEVFEPPVWVQLKSGNSLDKPQLEPLDSAHESFSKDSNLWKRDELAFVKDWLGCVEVRNTLTVGARPPVWPEDEVMVKMLSEASADWTSEHDEQLVECLTAEADTLFTGANQFVENITASSSCGEDNELNLLDDNADTFWESDGSHGAHWLKLKMKKGTVISKMTVLVDVDDDNYFPSLIVVEGGMSESQLVQLNEIKPTHASENGENMKEITILKDLSKHYRFIMIKIKDCKGLSDDGIDTRIHQIKITSSPDEDRKLSLDLFSGKTNMSRFPIIQQFTKMQLYCRALLLHRLSRLMDTILILIIPRWGDSIGTFTTLDPLIQLLLPLSTKRQNMITNLLQSTETKAPNSGAPTVKINRLHAADHRTNPELDTRGKRSVFNQIYESMKPSKHSSQFNYRWPSHFSMWWECKFHSEGIIDQGGGFRDTISDMSEELCPPDPEQSQILPYFIRTPNQIEGSNYTDCYIPNSSCKLFDQYKWLGTLMGACFRGKEKLVLTLAPFFWKLFTRKSHCWNDYATVNEAVVEKLTDMSKDRSVEDFDKLYADQMWLVAQANGQTEELMGDSSHTQVKYEDRLKYLKSAQQHLLQEMDAQVDAIRCGFLLVVPETVMSLLTWQEVEKGICGEPEISIEELRRSVRTDFGSDDDSSEKMSRFWKAMEQFTNDDRSRFLRFVTGRKRLPCHVYISHCKCGTPEDSLPEVSTCSKTLYLPEYSSVERAVEKLRYAAYNCLAIDTDRDP